MLDYLKNLTQRQWLIILSVAIFFVAAYFIFLKKSPVSPEGQDGVDIERLIQQGTAPISTEENLSRSEIQKLLKQSTAPEVSQTGSSQTPNAPKSDLTKEQKDELFKLMSAPR